MDRICENPTKKPVQSFQEGQVQAVLDPLGRNLGYCEDWVKGPRGARQGRGTSQVTADIPGRSNGDMNQRVLRK